MLELQNLTRVVMLYEIYKTRLRRVSYISYEITKCVRFCLSYDPLRQDFIAFKMKINLIKNIVDMDVVNHVTCTRKSAITRVVIRYL